MGGNCFVAGTIVVGLYDEQIAGVPTATAPTTTAHDEVVAGWNTQLVVLGAASAVFTITTWEISRRRRSARKRKETALDVFFAGVDRSTLKLIGAV